MIPLHALIRRNNAATMTIAIISLNVLVYLWEFIQSPYRQQVFVMHYAMVPDHLRLTTLLTSMFLHAGWVHLIGNMWFLWVFGSHIEDVMGSPRFLFSICLRRRFRRRSTGHHLEQPRPHSGRQWRHCRRHGRVSRVVSARPRQHPYLYFVLHHHSRNSRRVHAHLLVRHPTGERPVFLRPL